MGRAKKGEFRVSYSGDDLAVDLQGRERKGKSVLKGSVLRLKTGEEIVNLAHVESFRQRENMLRLRWRLERREKAPNQLKVLR